MDQQGTADTVNTHRLALSNMIDIEALVELLIRKGLITRQEIYTEIEALCSGIREDAGLAPGFE